MSNPINLVIAQLTKEKAPDNPPVRLAFDTDCEGSILIEVVDEEGHHVSGGYLLKISPNGRISKCKAVSAKFGFDLDRNGRIKFSSEDA
mgnify:CR=1 FL=1